MERRKTTGRGLSRSEYVFTMTSEWDFHVFNC